MSILPTEEDEVDFENSRTLRDLLAPKNNNINNNNSNSSNNNNIGNNKYSVSNNESDNEDDIEKLEEYLASLDSKIIKNEKRLREKEDELAIYIQGGNMNVNSYTLSFHQLAQNLAVTDQILSSSGLDPVDISLLNKSNISKQVTDQSLLMKYATKAVQTTVSEAWEEFKKKRITQLTKKEESFNLLPNSNNHAHLASKINAFGHKIISFLKEDIEVMKQVFRGVGSVLHLVYTLYHSLYSRRIRESLSLSSSSSSSSPSSSPPPPLLLPLPPRSSSPTTLASSPRHSSSPRLSSHPSPRHPSSSPRPSSLPSSSPRPSLPSPSPRPSSHSSPSPPSSPSISQRQHPHPSPVRRQSSEFQFQGRSRSESNASNAATANTTTISSASNATIAADSTPTRSLDWDEWSSLCLDVRKNAAAFAKEVARACGVNSANEFERYFPLVPVFHEVCIGAGELLSEKISKTFTENLDVEKDVFNQNKTYPSTHIPSRNTFRSHPHLSDSPLLKKRELNLSPNIALSVSTIIKNLDDSVEFVASLQFRPLIDTFLRSILPPMITLIDRLSLAARDVPQVNNIDFLYTSLNSAAALQERFFIYEQVLAPAHRSFYFTPSTSLAPLHAPAIGPTNKSRSGTRTPMLVPLNLPPEGFQLNTSTSNLSYAPSMANMWECQRLIDVELYKQADHLVVVLIDFCCAHIFPNIDTNEWQDHRIFYADSRPSHGIQMLHFFLKSQYHILHTHMLHHCVQYVISNTLRHCCELLVARYSAISPSKMRSNHYRFDITYLVAIIQSLQSACGIWYDKLSMSSICSSLVSLMAVVIGPLELVCSFLQRYSRQKKPFVQPSTSVVTNPSPYDGIIPHFPSELWPGVEISIRGEVLPIEDMQFLIEKHSLLAAYQYNYSSILENCCIEFSPAFLVTLVAHRPELKETVYPPLTDSEKELIPTLLDFLRPP